MDCLVATLSVDPVKSHEKWLEDVVAHCENDIEVKFPIIDSLHDLIRNVKSKVLVITEIRFSDFTYYFICCSNVTSKITMNFQCF